MNTSTTYKILKPTKIFFAALFVFLMLGVGSVSGATITISTSINWSAITTGSGPGGLPSSSDDIIVRNGKTLTVNVSNAVCASIQLGGTTSTGTGTLTFSGTNPSVTVSGLVQVGGWGSNTRDGFITFTNTATLNSGSVIFGGTGGTPAQGTITMTAGGTLVTGSLAVGVGGGGAWTPGTGTVNLDATNTLPATIFTSFYNLQISAGTTTLGVNLNSIAGGGLTVHAGATLALGAFTFGATTAPPSLTMDGGTSLTGASITGTGALALGGNVTITDATTGTNGATISCPVALGGTRTFTVADDGTSATDLTISGIISGAFGITKAGTGTMALAALNTYTGATLINAGTIDLGISSAVATAGPLGTTAGTTTVSTGAVLDLNGFSLTGAATNPLALNGTGILSAGALINSSGTAGSLVGDITGTYSVGGSGNITLTGNVQGTLTKVGTNTLTLGGTPDNVGLGVIANSGTVILAKTSLTNVHAIGGGGLTIAGATVQLSGTGGDQIYDGCTVTINSGTLDMNAQSESIDGLTGTGGTIQNNGGSASTLTFGIGNSSNTYSGIIANGTSGSGGMSIVKAGTGTYTLSGLNTYSGSTTVNGGILKAGVAAQSFGIASAVILANTAGVGLDITGFNTTIGSLTGGGATGGNVTLGAATLTIGSDNTSPAAYAGIISGTGAITKSGTGALIFSGANTYTGLTTISVGTLKLGASTSVLGTIAGITSVTSGAVLDLNGFTLSTVEPLTLNGTGISNGGALINSSGTATNYNGAITLGSASSIGTTGNITLGAGITGGQDLTKVGAGILSLGSSTATLGKITISAGTLTSTSGTLNLSGDFTNNAIFTHNSGTVTFTGNSSAINGTATTQTFNNIVVNKTSGQTLGTGGSTTTLNVGGTFTQTTGNFTAPTNMTVTGNTTLTAGTFNATTSLTLSGNFTNNGATFTAGAGTVTMNGSGKTIGGSTSTTFNNLTINNSGGASLGIDIDVSGTLSLTSGRLTLGTNNLTVAFISGTFNSSNMVVASSTGELRKLISVNGVTLFPVGTGTTDYTPISINFASGTYAGGAYVGIKVTNSKHPQNSSVTNYLNRYWSVSQSGISAYSCTITGTYLPADIAGTEGSQVAAKYIGSLPWIKYSTLSSNTLTASGVTSMVGDYTGVNDIPTITTTGTLTNFSYLLGLGPSAEQSFTVSGVDLNTNIILTPTSHLEISTGTGGSFVPSSIITLNVLGEIVTTKTIYVRMKAGLSVASYNDTIYCSSTGATTKAVYATGTVSNAPNISASVTTLTGFNYIVGGGPSAEQTYTVSGAYLGTNNIIITPPTNYEISKFSGGSFVATNPITLTPSSGTVPTTNIYVRLKSGLTSAYYDGETIAMTSTGATTQNITCSGIVYTPTISPSTTSLGGFIYTAGSGLPSSEQSFIVSGAHLTNNITVTPTSNFEISLTSGSGFQLTPLTLTQTSGTVASTTIYIRLKAGLALGTYSSENIALTSGGATTRNVALSGASVVSTNTIVTSVSSIIGISYTLNAGPSTPHSFTTSATSLGTNNLIITATTNFEISLSSGSGYTSGTITLTPSSGIVPATPIYVRLKAGITPAATIPAENITLVSSGATSQNVACSGAVVNGPVITASGGGATCTGSTISLGSSGSNYTNQYWEGPNSFYSTIASPSITNAQAVNAGTYTVTASGLSGINLATNGDFESGNIGFTSSYTYRDSTFTPICYGEHLGCEGNYTIVAIPHNVHSAFSSWPDHTASPGKFQMVVNGAATAGVVVWSQSVNVLPNTNYQFSYWEQTVVATNPSILQLYVNGVPSGGYYTAPSSINQWAQFVYNVNTGSNTVASLELINQNIIANGNDFALDDIVFQEVISVKDSVAVTVNPNVTASVSIVASATNIYTGTPVTFTATPVNGGTSPTYQWKLNGGNVGTNSPTYTNSTLANGNTITCVMTSNASCISGSPATSNTITMVVTPRQNYWVGTTNNNWSVGTNWSAGFEPVAGDDVEFANGTNYSPAASRDLWLDADKTIGSLINPSTGKKLVIPAGKSLIVNNNITTNNSDTIIYIYAGTSSTPNGSLIFHNPSDLPVHATVEMYSKANWDATGVQDPNTLIWYHYNWQYFGIPVTTVTAEPTFYGSYIRKWDETGSSISNHWVSLANSSVLDPFKGYEITQQDVSGKTIVFQGQLVNSNFSSANPLTITSTALFPGQYIFSNPYTAAIDIRQLTLGSGTDGSVYLYNTGSFGAWVGIAGVATQNGTTYNPGQYISVPIGNAGYAQLPRQIPSMGAMLIRPYSTATNVNYNFSINYNSVVMKNTDAQRAPQVNGVSSSDKVGIIIDVKGAHAADRMWIFTEPTSTRGFDNGWDGQKILGSAMTPQLYAIEKDGNYQVNTVPDMNDTELAFQAGQDVEDTLTFTNMNLEKQYAGVYLVDLLENRTIDITTSGTQYAFMAASTPTPVTRFKIVTRPYEKNAPDTETQMKIFSSESTIFVQNLSNVDGECRVYDIAGHYLMKVPFSANSVTAVTNNLRPGAYIAMAIAGGEKVSKRLIVQ